VEYSLNHSCVVAAKVKKTHSSAAIPGQVERHRLAHVAQSDEQSALLAAVRLPFKWRKREPMVTCYDCAPGRSSLTDQTCGSQCLVAEAARGFEPAVRFVVSGAYERLEGLAGSLHQSRSENCSLGDLATNSGPQTPDFGSFPKEEKAKEDRRFESPSLHQRDCEPAGPSRITPRCKPPSSSVSNRQADGASRRTRRVIRGTARRAPLRLPPH
jgi:hypothetical protein